MAREAQCRGVRCFESRTIASAFRSNKKHTMSTRLLAAATCNAARPPEVRASRIVEADPGSLKPSARRWQAVRSPRCTAAHNSCHTKRWSLLSRKHPRSTSEACLAAELPIARLKDDAKTGPETANTTFTQSCDLRYCSFALARAISLS